MSEKISTRYTETEQKFLPLHPEKLDRFKLNAAAINQPYLSHPSEEFSLRLREQTKGGETSYEVTLKNMGAVGIYGLKRLEVPGDLSKERYEYYNADVPIIRKLRAEPHENIVIDFFEDGHIHAESEDPAAWQHFLEANGFENDFVNVTGEKYVDNEWRAHFNYWNKNNGRNPFTLEKDLEADEMVDKILGNLGKEPLVVAVGGRSGSGKTTLLGKVREQLYMGHGIKVAQISTDSYNLGKKRLEQMGGGSWPNLDSNETYDLPLCLEHVRILQRGLVIPEHNFNFDIQEPRHIEHVVHPGKVILVEGIKAHHPDFKEIADLSFVMPTPLATSIGRRIVRDLRYRPKFAEPSTNLSYYLEYAEPEYRALL